jgi:hypothetical protein
MCERWDWVLLSDCPNLLAERAGQHLLLRHGQKAWIPAGLTFAGYSMTTAGTKNGSCCLAVARPGASLQRRGKTLLIAQEEAGGILVRAL